MTFGSGIARCCMAIVASTDGNYVFFAGGFDELRHRNAQHPPSHGLCRRCQQLVFSGECSRHLRSANRHMVCLLAVQCVLAFKSLAMRNVPCALCRMTPLTLSVARMDPAGTAVNHYLLFAGYTQLPRSVCIYKLS